MRKVPSFAGPYRIGTLLAGLTVRRGSMAHALEDARAAAMPIIAGKRRRGMSKMYGKVLRSFAATLMVSGMAMSGANAAELTTIGATWSNVSGEDGNAPTDLSNSGNTLSWGDPANNDNEQSQYIFDGVENMQVTLPSPQGETTELDNIGNFTHNNRAITGNPLQSATLNIPLELTNGDLVSADVQFNFVHTETPNDQDDPRDRVNIAGDTPAQIFQSDGTDYEFEITGFLQGDEVVSTFFTDEGQLNEAQLAGRITNRGGDIPVPAPASLGLLGVGLIGLGLITARHKRT
jgi:hypothetical protein